MLGFSASFQNTVAYLGLLMVGTQRTKCKTTSTAVPYTQSTQFAKGTNSVAKKKKIPLHQKETKEAKKKKKPKMNSVHSGMFTNLWNFIVNEWIIKTSHVSLLDESKVWTNLLNECFNEK